MSTYGYTMGLKNTVRKQYQAIINEAAAGSLQNIKPPKEGWIASTRKALGMSAAQLGRMVGRTRANISAAEQSEQEERATLQTIKTMAEAMGCKLVYAIVPAEGSIEDVIEKQARKKARALVKQASTHMALEKQSLGDAKVEEEISRITLDLLNKQPSDFWKDE
jgi:predicted DNA-binding mobile mystery protein A